MTKNITKKSVKHFLDDFKAFINRGNVAELAVGIMIGGAFNKIVSSLVQDIVTPVIGVLLGGINFSSLSVTVPNIFGAPTGSRIAYGMFIQNIIDFIVIAFTIFTFIHIYNKIQAKKLEKDAKDDTKKSEKAAKDDAKAAEIALLTEIRDLLKKSPSPKK